MNYDVLIRNGTIIDGTGAPRFAADIGIRDGKLAAIGRIGSSPAELSIDAAGAIVAPGIIDLHTHYDAQLHWDPYCTSSGWHGTTSVVVGNCGFGFAPCPPKMRERYMRMMENTEQIPYEAMKTALPWTWETFPEWMDHLERLPKGVNVASFLPMNALLSYVVGPDEAKRRPATEAERARMRELLHEAMDAGASGFGFSYLGATGNSHVDYDHSPMPADVMAPEEVYNLCEVLRGRGEGVIQILCELPGNNSRRTIAEEVARRSGRPVLHTIMLAVEGLPEMHRDTLRWLDEVTARGLDIYSQALTFRAWQEFEVMNFTGWEGVPVFRTLGKAGTVAEKLALVANPSYRERMRNEYEPATFAGQVGGRVETFVLLEAPGSATFAKYENYQIQAIASALERPLTDTFLDILCETKMRAHFRIEDTGGRNTDYLAEMLNNPRVLPGISDGGAHSKFATGGLWSTDMILWLARETRTYDLETLHNMMSARPAAAIGFKDRGLIREGYAADLMVYDFEELDYERNRYAIAHDMPDGDWRRTCPVKGIHYVIVNGEITFKEGVCSGATPGMAISNAVSESPRRPVR